MRFWHTVPEKSLCRWLGKFCRLVDTEEASNSRSKIHQTTYKDFFQALYNLCMRLLLRNPSLKLGKGSCSLTRRSFSVEVCSLVESKWVHALKVVLSSDKHCRLLQLWDLEETETPSFWAQSFIWTFITYPMGITPMGKIRGGRGFFLGGSGFFLGLGMGMMKGDLLYRRECTSSASMSLCLESKCSICQASEESMDIGNRLRLSWVSPEIMQSTTKRPSWVKTCLRKDRRRQRK